MIIDSTLPKRGFAPRQVFNKCVMRGGAATKGKIYALDLNGAQITADSLTPTTDPYAGAASVFGSVRGVEAADIEGGIFVVALEDVADGGVGNFGIAGIFPVVSGANGFDEGHRLAVNASELLVSDETPSGGSANDLGSGSFHCLGIALETAVGGALGKVLFNGATGLPGVIVAT
jgi:predicted RecA/RadA family phage recombinase